jgi:hypothetical protein
MTNSPPPDIRKYFTAVPLSSSVSQKELLLCDDAANQTADGCAVLEPILSASHSEHPAESQVAKKSTATQAISSITSSSSTDIAKKRNKRVMSTSDSEAEQALTANARKAQSINEVQVSAVAKPADVTHHHVDSDSSSDSVYMLLHTAGAAQPEPAQLDNSNDDSALSQPNSKRKLTVTKSATQPRQTCGQTSRKKSRSAPQPTVAKVKNTEQRVCRNLLICCSHIVFTDAASPLDRTRQ